jgi:hypothetical protein
VTDAYLWTTSPRSARDIMWRVPVDEAAAFVEEVWGATEADDRYRLPMAVVLRLRKRYVDLVGPPWDEDQVDDDSLIADLRSGSLAYRSPSGRWVAAKWAALRDPNFWLLRGLAQEARAL